MFVGRSMGGKGLGPWAMEILSQQTKPKLACVCYWSSLLAACGNLLRAHPSVAVACC